jgi:DNA-binding transcriptional MerR regulator/methanogenic corrinoid protein MtbC1
MQYFNIRVASQLSGVASATIRAWEKRYNAIQPDRGDNGHRLYSERDIEKLALLFKLTEVGQGIGKIAHLDLEELKIIYSKLLHQPYEEKHLIAPSKQNVDYKKILNNLFLALSSYKVDILSHELDKARTELSPRDFGIFVILPLFREIGLKVDRGELNISQERTISSLATFYIGQMIGSHYQKVFHRNDLILIATPEGEFHELGILVASLLCVHYGLRFILMGANLPCDSIAEAARALNCKAVLIGATRQAADENSSLEKFLFKLKDNIPANTQLWVGGNISLKVQQQLKRLNLTTFESMNSLDEFLSQF